MSRHPDPDDAAIGGRLRQARAEARITEAEAAAALDIPRPAASELEAGTRRLAAAEHADAVTPAACPPWCHGHVPGDVGPAVPSSAKTAISITGR